ncbi:MAG: hypothetical protein A2506_03995 [Elusimicrobia bacterium RIFOXYD12_FULL_66_9]|nr:MAG: hypothetical protein A2506_03995 [Elusimicrobia bacterium RIFOXYD12_FULL_66_9]
MNDASVRFLSDREPAALSVLPGEDRGQDAGRGLRDVCAPPEPILADDDLAAARGRDFRSVRQLETR